MCYGSIILSDNLEFGGESPLTVRARCSTFRFCPDPLGIVTAEQLNKLEFDELFDALPIVSFRGSEATVGISWYDVCSYTAVW